MALSRRRFLTSALAVGAGAAGLRLAAPADAAAAADIDFAALRQALTGQLILPGDTAYAQARLPFNSALAARAPLAIAQVANAADVATTVRLAAGKGAPFAARCGGHSYAGYSTPDAGVIVDVSALSSVTVRPDGTAVVGAGARLIQVYSALAAAGRALPGGTCATVGISGLALGGGIGVLTRQYGLTCDNIVAATVVTADGQIRTVDATRDPNLLWALRGGGGGHAGVVVDFTFRTVPAPQVTIFELNFPPDRTAAALAAWSAWLTAAPPELTSTLDMGGGSAPSNQIFGTWTGNATGLNTQLSQLITAVGVNPSSRSSTPMSYLDAMKHFAHCSGQTTQQCGQARRSSFAGASRMVDRPFTAESAGRLVEAMRNRGVLLLIDGMGGRVLDTTASDAAFPHRTAHASVQIYTGGSGQSAVDATQKAITPIVGSNSYVNYIHPGQSDWATSYWGANRAKLRSVVAAYDPAGAFSFPQSVLLTS